MGLNLPRSVSSRTSSISTKNLSETKYLLAVIGVSSAEKQLRAGRGARTGTQRRAISYQGNEREHRTHG